MIFSPKGELYFSKDELKCKGSGKLQFAEGFEERLKFLRYMYEKPMVITSACRSKEHNKAIGGHPRSLHVCDEPYHPIGGTAAVDIACTDGEIRGRLFMLAWKFGWSVGLAKTFLHMDRRIDYNIGPQTTYYY